MQKNEVLLMEFEREADKTRKMLERVPLDKSDWKPHEKSFTLGRLASHVAELSSWVDVTLNQDELDFSKMDYKPVVAETTEELLKIFDDNREKAVKTLKDATDEKLMSDWTMRDGDTVFFTAPKIGVLRDFVLNHTIHHRAQLGVYLRMNDVPLPQMFGPTADEPM
jgi:uncharacterized damage-inducible protein DinB